MENRSETRELCPHCEGKGDISVLVDPQRAGYPQRGLNSRTWLPVPCPFCNGKGDLSGSPGTLFAKGNDAKAIQVDVTKRHTEALLNELQAIDYWDAKYEKQFNPEEHDTVAYISRERRRGEIIRELSCLSQNKRRKK